MTRTKKPITLSDAGGKQGWSMSFPAAAWRKRKREGVSQAAWGLMFDVCLFSADQKDNAFISDHGMKIVLRGDPNGRRKLRELVEHGWLIASDDGWTIDRSLEQRAVSGAVMNAGAEITAKLGKPRTKKRSAAVDRSDRAVSGAVMNAGAEITQESSKNSPKYPDRDVQPGMTPCAASGAATCAATCAVSGAVMNAGAEITQESALSRARAFPNSQFPEEREREKKSSRSPSLSMRERVEQLAAEYAARELAQQQQEAAQNSRAAPSTQTPVVAREDVQKALGEPGRSSIRLPALRVVSTLTDASTATSASARAVLSQPSSSASLPPSTEHHEEAALTELDCALRTRFVAAWEQRFGCSTHLGGKNVGGLAAMVRSDARLQKREPLVLYDEALRRFLSRDDLNAFEQRNGFAAFVQDWPRLVARPKPLVSTDAEREAESLRKVEEVRAEARRMAENNARIMARF